MSRRIDWSGSALHDMLSIFELITESSPQNALLVDDRVHEQIKMLTEFPLAGRDGKVGGTRELVIQKASCVVVYAVREDAIYILNIMYRGQLQSCPCDLSFVDDALVERKPTTV
jgi:toxin ParE1/3/4